MENANDKGFEITDLHHHEKWILSELNNVIADVTKSIEIYRFDDACNTIYQFVYEKFCSWFIELSKGILNSENQNLKAQRANVLKHCFKEIVKLLHPVTPFITEEIWSFLKKEDEDLLIAQDYPLVNADFNFESDVSNMEKFIEIVTSIRNLRNAVMIKPKEEIEIRLYTDDEDLAKYLFKSRGFFKELAKVKSGKIKDKSIERPAKSIMRATGHTEVFIPLEGVIDIDVFVQKLQNDKIKAQRDFDKVDKKLKNPKFIENAPDDVVEKVKTEAKEFKDKLDSINNSLENFQ